MDKELRIILYSFIPPAFFVLLLWGIMYMEYSSGYGFDEFGVFPRNVKGLKGILFYPLIHGDMEHLLSNSLPLLMLGAAMVFFYRQLAIRVVVIIWLLSGFGLWLGGREVYHIGASGLVYGLAFFLFASGILRRDPRLMAISLLVVFLYGSMVWGVFPLWRGISWEGHLFGSLAGILCAVVFRHEGPQRQPYIWETEEETNEEDATTEEHLNDPGKEEVQKEQADQNGIEIKYHFKENKPAGNEPEKN